jgi:hypothetical protein
MDHLHQILDAYNDFVHIAAISALQHEWVVPAGSVD